MLGIARLEHHTGKVPARQFPPELLVLSPHREGTAKGIKNGQWLGVTWGCATAFAI
jgi:hypothetical protein